jgi:TDG/mug DNA glycosylase family protein
VLEPGLRVVFCGTAAGRVAALRGAPYSGPGNKFWRILFETGLTPELVPYERFRDLPRWGIGLTDVNKTESGSDSDLTAASFDPGGLVARLEGVRPAFVAFNGKRSAQVVLGRTAVSYGPQPETVADARVWVVPSTSGAASGFWDPAPWHALAELVSRSQR